MKKFVAKGTVKTMENNFNKFRRAAFGGFNREDVIRYIEKMKNEFFDYKKEVELTVEQLNSKIRELEEAYEAVSTPMLSERTAVIEEAEEVNPVSDINEATRKLRSVADELCKNLSNFMVKVTENSVIAESEELQSEEDISDAVVEIEVATVQEDKVALILKATSSFSCSISNEENLTAENEEVKQEKKNILDVLGGASFLK